MSIKIDNVSYTYMKKTPYERTALNEVSLTIEKGEYVAVIGHTGSGKSTLMQHFNGLLNPDSGSVRVDGIDINAKGEQAKSARGRVGMVFQYPEHQIFAETVYEDIAFGPRNKGFSEEEAEKQVRAAMKFVGLDFESYAKRSPFQLSGGQMRRVAIAGVVAMAPDYLILDEPSAGLDPSSRDSIFQEISRLHRKREIAVILVTHSMEEAAQYADRLLVLAKGKIAVDGKTHEVFKSQRDMLKSVGVDVPQTVKLADVLREQGLAIDADVIKPSELVRQIKKAKGWR